MSLSIPSSSLNKPRFAGNMPPEPPPEVKAQVDAQLQAKGHSLEELKTLVTQGQNPFQVLQSWGIQPPQPPQGAPTDSFNGGGAMPNMPAGNMPMPA
jgi:hypothetical protein